MANLVIGIEGLVGAGKTSICRELLKRLGNTVLVNGGNIYRAIVYAMMKNGKQLEELKKAGKKIDIKKMMDIFKIEIKIENQETILYMNGQKLDEEILQSKEASLAVSVVGGSADNRNLFLFAKELVEDLKNKYHVILAGRSVMKIYPDCDYHFFIVASLEERVKRKCIQYGNTENQNEIKQNIEKRDALQKEAGFYEYSPITIEIDVTNCDSVEESTDLVLKQIKLAETV